MRLSARFARTFLTVGMLVGSALGFGGCGRDYALYKVHIQFKSAANAQAPLILPANLENVAYCQVTISDESGNPVLENSPINGCATSVTPSDLGYLSYSTSRTTGSLKFTMTAYDDSNKAVDTGSTDLIPVKAYPPEIGGPPNGDLYLYAIPIPGA
jgi:hypothetical protein